MIYTCPHSRPQTQYQYLIHGMIYSSGPRLLHQYSKRRNCKVNISCRDIDIVDGPISQPGEWLRKRPAHLQSTPRAVTRWTSRPGDWQRRRRAGIGAPAQSKPRAVTRWPGPPVQAALFWHDWPSLTKGHCTQFTSYSLLPKQWVASLLAPESTGMPTIVFCEHSLMHRTNCLSSDLPGITNSVLCWNMRQYASGRMTITDYLRVNTLITAVDTLYHTSIPRVWPWNITSL